jgi:hypothetical protein
MINLNRLATCVFSGAMTGVLIGGIGARLAMRAVALIGGIEPAFTLGGTLAICIMGAILGLLAGGVLGLLWRWLPGRAVVKGTLFGAVSAVLVAILFLRVGGGELNLAAPAVRAALFAWIPLAWGAASGWLAGRLGPRFAGTSNRQVGIAAFALFGLCLLLALLSMFSLASESLSLPPLMARFLGSMGWVGYRNAHALAMALFSLAYAGLCALLFWQSGGGRMGSLAAMSLLLFAAGFVQSGRALTSALDFLGLGQALTGLARAAGLTGLLATLLLWPDGVFRSAWGRWALIGWGGVWLLLWFLLPLFGLQPTALPEAVLLLAVMGGLWTGLVGQWQGYRQPGAAGRAARRPVVLVLAFVLLSYFLVWTAQIMYPTLRARGLPPLATPLAFFPFLLPWLLLPFGFWLSTRRMEQLAIARRLGPSDTSPQSLFVTQV